MAGSVTQKMVCLPPETAGNPGPSRGLAETVRIRPQSCSHSLVADNHDYVEPKRPMYCVCYFLEALLFIMMI